MYINTTPIEGPSFDPFIIILGLRCLNINIINNVLFLFLGNDWSIILQNTRSWLNLEICWNDWTLLCLGILHILTALIPLLAYWRLKKKNIVHALSSFFAMGLFRFKKQIVSNIHNNGPKSVFLWEKYLKKDFPWPFQDFF